MKLDELAPNDHVYRYWDSVAFGAEVQHLTVIRVNRVTATVETKQGARFRIAPEKHRWART